MCRGVHSNIATLGWLQAVSGCLPLGIVQISQMGSSITTMWGQLAGKASKPQSSILMGFSFINPLFWGTPIYGNHHMGISFSGAINPLGFPVAWDGMTSFRPAMKPVTSFLHCGTLKSSYPSCGSSDSPRLRNTTIYFHMFAAGKKTIYYNLYSVALLLVGQ